ncbi:hypothetical protein ACRALDRAFT_2114713, partial [Sodiomyces alcalophilus JCM 7366]|uniref:uncharacterized protein n=1 Tax=Sodiomyces alcalophilus JCM 7366 TaxID=591952 RepID=UPI0039B60323
VRASTLKTPQPSPAYHSAVLMVQGRDQEFTTTPTRLAALRGTSLVRDRHRCVISRAFDVREARKRVNRGREPNPKDDDGNALSGPFAYLEVAHIIPHSLVRPQANSESRQAALAILNMFDIGVARLIEGVEIDRPFNTLSLALDHHRTFGEFLTFFTPVPDSPPHTYRIETFEHASLTSPLFPVTRTLLLSPDRNIDPPSSRLLAVHRAIAHILHLSAAGEYIDRFLSDMDEGCVRTDGSTELGKFVKLRMRDLDNVTVDSR